MPMPFKFHPFLNRQKQAKTTDFDVLGNFLKNERKGMVDFLVGSREDTWRCLLRAQIIVVCSRHGPPS